MKYLKCIVCEKECLTSEIMLMSGKVLHHSCHELITSQCADFESRLGFVAVKLVKLIERSEKMKSFRYRLTHPFSTKGNKEANSRELNDVRNELRQLQANLKPWKELRSLIYDNWPTYPPDWNERRDIVFDEAECCEICGSIEYLHVHHQVPISKGGNHKIENLMALCESCHEAKHGHSILSYSSKSVKSVFKTKLEFVADAIQSGKLLHFKYKDMHGKVSYRTIRPSDFKTPFKNLCVVGYCFLDKDIRHFAIKRMGNLKSESLND